MFAASKCIHVSHIAFNLIQRIYVRDTSVTGHSSCLLFFPYCKAMAIKVHGHNPSDNNYLPG